MLFQVNWLTRFFTDLNEFEIEPCPVKRVVVEEKVPDDQEGEIINGQRWKTQFNHAGFDSERAISHTPGKRVTTLTGWDIAYLNEYHKNAFTKAPTWKRTMAEGLKVEWATIMDDGEYPSAERIVANHTESGKKEPQKGYGLSNVKKYLHAFNDALRRELEEKQSK